MKYQESGFGSKSEFADYIKGVVPKLFKGELAVEGRSVSIPSDGDLDYKVKYDEDEAGGSFTIKVSWDNGIEDDDEVTVDTD